MGQGDRVPSPRVRAYGDEGGGGHRRIRCSAADARKEREAPCAPGDAEGQEDHPDPSNGRRPCRYSKEPVDRQSGPWNPDIEEDEECAHLRPGRDPPHPPPETPTRVPW